MKLNVAIAGATGWVGKPLCAAVAEADDLKLVGAVSRSHAGESLGDVINDVKLDLKISGSVAEALAAPPRLVVRNGFTRAVGSRAEYRADLEAGAALESGDVPLLATSRGQLLAESLLAIGSK